MKPSKKTVAILALSLLLGVVVSLIPHASSVSAIPLLIGGIVVVTAMTVVLRFSVMVGLLAFSLAVSVTDFLLSH